MSYAVIYLATLIPFLVIDIIVIRTVMLPLFERNIGPLMADETRLDVAMGFYLLYVVGIVYFAVQPALATGEMMVAIKNGAFLGLIAYATYEMTNMATLRGWSWQMVVIDTGWGAMLGAISAALGFLISRSFLGT